MGSGVGLGAVSAWLIARAAQLPPVLDLSIAATAVRTFGVGKAIFRYLERISSHWIALYGMAAIRTQVYQRLASSSIDTVTAIKRGDLLARTGADVDELGDVVVKSLLPTAVAIVTALISITIVTILSPLIGLIFAISLLFAGAVGPYLAMRGARIAEINQVHDRAELNIQALTLLENAEELRISGNLAEMEAAQERTEKQIWKNHDRAAIPTATAAAIDLFSLAVSVVSAIIIGSLQVSAGTLSTVNLVVVTLTPLAAFESTQRLKGAGVQLIRSARAAIRITELIGSAQSLDIQIRNAAQNTRNTDQVSSAPLFPNTQSLSLTAENLAIGWPGGPNIGTGISLNLTPGKTIAIVGKSGIGKSTLLYTLAGMIQPHSGNVLIGGKEVGLIERTEISKHLILTAEDAHIFETSVLENLRVVRADLTPAEAQELLKRAGLGKWLTQLPDGVETMLGANAATISGGERRRLLLARALASPADFLLLDEPGEHLDANTADQLIRDLLNSGKLPAKEFSNPQTDSEQSDFSRLQRKRGIILVTHRLSPLDAADEVIMLGNNPTQIIARGTHAELVAANNTYRWLLEQETPSFEE
ncbi:thiol reductant ABC exporter subunit CydC [Arcanobacterium hippocoleae]